MSNRLKQAWLALCEWRERALWMETFSEKFRQSGSANTAEWEAGRAVDAYREWIAKGRRRNGE